MDDTLGSSGFSDFDRMSALFRRTRALLDATLATGDLPDGGTEMLAHEALPHIEDVEAGFRVWLRAGTADLAELRALILHGALGLPPASTPAEERAALAEALRARLGAGGDRDIVPAPVRRLAALEHARLVFALLPRMAAADVRFPGPRPTYADISAPRSPGELALRIEELERQLWWIATGHVPPRSDGGLRRTYGFFDAAERLTSLGFKRPD